MVLANAPDEPLASNLAIDGRRIVEVADLCQSDYVEQYNRRNRSRTISFDGSHYHDTEYAAALFALDHDDEIPILADVTIELGSGNQTARRTFRNAGIEAVRLVGYKGLTTLWNYVIKASRMERT